MQLGRVVGHAVSTIKHASFQGWRLLVVQALTPDGKPDPSIFSTGHNREGIQVGTAIATLIRKPAHVSASTIEFPQVWGASKRQQLLIMPDR